MEDKNLSAFLGSLRDAHHPLPFLDLILSRVLVGGVSRQRQMEKVIPSWRIPLFGVALNAIGEGQVPSHFRADMFFGYRSWGGEHRERPLGFKNVSVGLNKQARILWRGGIVLADKKAGSDIVVTVEPWEEDLKVECYYSEGDEALAEKFFSEIDEFIKRNNFYRGAKVDARGVFLNLGTFSLEDVVLPGDLMREIVRNVHERIEKEATYVKYGIPTKRGILLGGAPGTGKTMLGKVLAKTLPCSFIWVTPRHLNNLQAVSGVYEFAREIAPSIVFIEDVDLFCLDRRMGEMHPLMGELLNTLDGIVENNGVITMLSTNYPELLDVALKDRPGRFDTKILLPYPGADECFKIFQKAMSRMRVSYQGSPEKLKAYSAKMADVKATGAYVVEVANYAAMLAIERGYDKGSMLVLTEKEIEDALTRMVASRQVADMMEKAVTSEGILKWGGWKHAER